MLEGAVGFVSRNQGTIAIGGVHTLVHTQDINHRTNDSFLALNPHHCMYMDMFVQMGYICIYIQMQMECMFVVHYLPSALPDA